VSLKRGFKKIKGWVSIDKSDTRKCYSRIILMRKKYIFKVRKEYPKPFVFELHIKD